MSCLRAKGAFPPGKRVRFLRRCVRLVATTWLLVAVVGCSGPMSLFGPQSTPTPQAPPADQAAVAFFRALERSDFDTLHDLLTAQSRKSISQGSLIELYQQAFRDARIYAVHASVLSVLQQATETQVAYHIAYDSGSVGRFERDHSLTMRLESGSWRVQWSPQIVWPQFGEHSRFKVVERIPARANIYDRNKLGLAVESVMVTIGLVPGQIPQQSTLLSTVSAVTGVPMNVIRDKVDGSPADWFVPIRDVPVEEFEKNGRELEGLPGVSFKQSFARAYNEGGVAAHVVGYVGKIRAEELSAWQEKGYRGDEDIGQAGLERMGEEYLVGRKGGILSIVDADGEEESLVVDRQAHPSRNLFLTLDRRLQAIALKALGGRRGAVVALDPSTGGVLVMASSPSYDPNQLIGAVEAATWQRLMGDPNRPLVNRAAQGTYPPGSVFKIVTEAAALEAAGYKPESPFLCGGTWYGLGGEWTKTCWLLTGHGRINLRDGLTASCDIVFYEVGKKMHEENRDLLPQYARAFGFGKPTGLEGVDEAAGLVPDGTWKQENLHETWYPGDTVNMAIGQGYTLVTPLQIAVMAAAVANGGKLLRPQLIQRVEGTEFEPEINLTPQEAGRVPVSEEHLKVIRKGLEGVTTSARGTAVQAFLDFPVEVAGKTGTAENQAEEPHAWFAGYAPVDNPQIVIVAIVEQGGEGAEAAAPVFRRVAEGFFGIQPPPPTPTSTVPSKPVAPQAQR